MGSVAQPLLGHLDAALTNFAKRFSQNGYVSDIIAPRVGVARQTDKYYIMGRENQKLSEQTLRGTGASAQRIRITLSTDSYRCASHALAADIPDEDRAGYQAGDLEQDATQTLMEKILLDKEDRLATMLSDTAQVTDNETLAGGDQFDQYGTSKPSTVIEDAKSNVRKSGVEANVIVCGEPVFTQLKNHPAILDAFKYTQPGVLAEQHLATFFGVERFLVARAVKLDAADVAGFVFGKHLWVMYVSQASSRIDVSALKTFVWESAPGTIGGFGVVTGRHPDPTAKSDIVGVDSYYDQKITATETIHLVKNAVA